jgi:chemotaxis protein CheX
MINTEIQGLLNITEGQLIEHLNKDIREIFNTMVGADLSEAIITVTKTKFKDCVTAMVGFAGSYNGMISINTPQKLAMGLASQMLGMEISECAEDVHDTIGEIANMIGGSFKHHFVVHGHEVRLSTPSVISGEEYFISIGSIPDTLTVMFKYGDEQFWVSVDLEVGE